MIRYCQQTIRQRPPEPVEAAQPVRPCRATVKLDGRPKAVEDRDNLIISMHKSGSTQEQIRKAAGYAKVWSLQYRMKRLGLLPKVLGKGKYE